ncbi:hypothetical protein MRX96_052967 [Rhipicephalus microplus]
MPRGPRVAETAAEAHGWTACLTADLCALCHLKRLHQAPDAGTLLVRLRYAPNCMSANFSTSTTLCLVIPRSLRAGHRRTVERLFESARTCRKYDQIATSSSVSWCRRLRCECTAPGREERSVHLWVRPEGSLCGGHLHSPSA